MSLLAGDGDSENGIGSAGERAVLGIGMIAIVVIVGRFVLPAALAYAARHRHAEAFSGLAMLAVALSALLMELAGLSMALRRLSHGCMLLSRSRYHHQLEADIAPFKGILLSLFFVSVGMSVDLAVLGDNLVLIAITVMVINVTKFACLLAVAKGSGFGDGDSIRIAGLLSQSGEFGFVPSEQHIPSACSMPASFVEAILVISASMAFTPLLTRFIDRFLAGRTDAATFGTDIPQLNRHVVLCGYGRAGRAVGAMLEAAGHEFVAIDYDPARVEQGQVRGAHVMFGNAADRPLLEKAGIGRAEAVVVTLDKPAAVRRVVSAIRNFYPEIRLIARASDLRSRERMVVEGVTHVVPEAVE
ncbi:MAG: NAD-binding protein [Geminicoccaceae bacterium]